MKGGRDILSGFGPEHNSPQRPSASSGGVMQAKPCDYKPPQGPIGINNPQSPGLHGQNYGISNGCHARGGNSGSVGLHGSNAGKTGSQK